MSTALSLSHLTTPVAHIVTWRLNGATPQARRQQADRVAQAFEALRAEVPGLLRMEVGANLSDAPDAWDVALCMVFASVADLRRYETHPAHLEIKALVGPMRAQRGQADFAAAA